MNQRGREKERERERIQHSNKGYEFCVKIEGSDHSKMENIEIAVFRYSLKTSVKEEKSDEKKKSRK